MSKHDYDRGWFRGIDDVLNLIPTIEEQGQEFRNEFFQKLMELRPPKEYNKEKEETE